MGGALLLTGHRGDYELGFNRPVLGFAFLHRERWYHVESAWAAREVVHEWDGVQWQRLPPILPDPLAFEWTRRVRPRVAVPPEDS